MNLNIQKVNSYFNECFNKADTFVFATTTRDIDPAIAELINNKIPRELEKFLNNGIFKIYGSIGKGLATRTPWIAILDKEITTSTREGVYIVFLFSSDYKHVYLTLNQGTTVPGQFGPRLGKKEIISNSKKIRDVLNINNATLKTDGNADIADEKYKAGAIYYTLWDADDKLSGEILLNTYLDIYKKYKNLMNSNKTTTTPIKATVNTTTIINQKPFMTSTLVSSLHSTGLIYSETLIKRLAYSLMAKPFVILSGLAGSGKTQLALAFAKCLSENIEEQVCTVSIGADWTNREPLLGYPNALKNNEYVLPESGVLQLLMRANDNPNKPYFLILDEMNLSVVERYFADFLSAMESGEPIKLWDNESEVVPKEIALPKNVFIIGTINVDETTYMFSPKVLDRANVIEFKIAPDEMEQYLNETKDIHLENAYSACADMAADFVNKAKSQIQIDNADEKSVLLSFFTELKKVNAEFGYRTVNEISRYLHFADEKDGLEKEKAIDTAILQKLLPKLHGSRKKLVPVLTSLWNLCLKDGFTKEIDAEFIKNDFKYPESAEKIQRMYNAVVDNGFTSFAEA